MKVFRNNRYSKLIITNKRQILWRIECNMILVKFDIMCVWVVYDI